MQATSPPLHMVSIYALKLLLIVLISVTWLFVDVDRVHACSCGPIDPSEALDHSAAVFSGEAVARHTLYQHDQRSFPSLLLILLAETTPGPGIATIVYEFKVNTIWKGPSYEYVYLREPFGEACGASFDPGEQYLVYSDGTSAGLCGSKRLAFAQDDLDELGEGEPPEPGTRAPRPSVMSDWISAEAMIRRLASSLYRLQQELDSKPPAPTPTAVPTPTPVPDTPTPQPTPTAVSTPTLPPATPTPQSTPTAMPTPTPVPATPTPQPTPTAVSTPTLPPATPTPQSTPTAVPIPTPVPATPTPQPTPTVVSTPTTLAAAVTPAPTPLAAPQPGAVGEGEGTPGWLIPAVAGVAGVLVGALATTLTLRRRGGGT